MVYATIEVPRIGFMQSADELALEDCGFQLIHVGHNKDGFSRTYSRSGFEAPSHIHAEFEVEVLELAAELNWTTTGFEPKTHNRT